MNTPNLRDIRVASDLNADASPMAQVIVAGTPGTSHIALRLICSLSRIPAEKEKPAVLKIEGGAAPIELEMGGAGIQQIDLGYYVCMDGKDLAITVTDPNAHKAEAPAHASPAPAPAPAPTTKPPVAPLQKLPTPQAPLHPAPHHPNPTPAPAPNPNPAPHKTPISGRLAVFYYSASTLVL